MQVITGGRRAGKTEEMIRLMAANPSMVLVCINQAEVQRLLYRYPEWENRVVSFDSARDGVLRGRGENMVLGLDNADMILSQLLGLNIHFMSVTGGVWRKLT